MYAQATAAPSFACLRLSFFFYFNFFYCVGSIKGRMQVQSGFNLLLPRLFLSLAEAKVSVELPLQFRWMTTRKKESRGMDADKVKTKLLVIGRFPLDHSARWSNDKNKNEKTPPSVKHIIIRLNFS